LASPLPPWRCTVSSGASEVFPRRPAFEIRCRTACRDLHRLASPSELSHRAGLANPPLLGSVIRHPHRHRPRCPLPEPLSQLLRANGATRPLPFRLRSFALPWRLAPPGLRGFVAPRCRSDVRRVSRIFRPGIAPGGFGPFLATLFTPSEVLLVDSRSASPRSVPSCRSSPSAGVCAPVRETAFPRSLVVRHMRGPRGPLASQRVARGGHVGLRRRFPGPAPPGIRVVVGRCPWLPADLGFRLGLPFADPSDQPGWLGRPLAGSTGSSSKGHRFDS